MNCIIPGLNLKVLARALHALAKIGDELFIKAAKDKLILITLNLRKTVCVEYHFLDSFFSSYEVDENEITEHNEVSCKILMKVLLPILKGTHIEKKLDYLKIEYENNSDILIFKMKFKCDDILMVHKLRLMECLTVEFSPDLGCNNVLATSSFFNQLLNMFSNLDDEITLEISKSKVVARNYVTGAPVKPKCVRSQVNLNASEFNTFQVDKETNINFSLKPLRTAIQFADNFNLNIGLNFETGGRPLIILMKNPTFEANFIVATLDPYSDFQNTMSTTSIPAKITQAHHNNPNISFEDQVALQNENWEDFDLDEPPLKKKPGKPKKSFKIDRQKGTKRFELLLDPTLEDKEQEEDVLPPSPESPRSKKFKLVFGRCFEPTFSESCLGKVLVPNSDSE